MLASFTHGQATNQLHMMTTPHQLQLLTVSRRKALQGVPPAGGLRTGSQRTQLIKFDLTYVLRTPTKLLHPTRDSVRGHGGGCGVWGDGG